MPVQIDVFDFKCFNQLRNGEAFDRNLSEFTPNLVGNIGETIKVEYTVNIQQSANTEGSEEWFIINDVSFKQIERSSGSFLEDGIQVGDIYNFYSDWQNRRSGSSEYSGTVEFISSDGKQLQYSVRAGTDTTNGNVTNVGIAFILSSQPPFDEDINTNKAAFLKFGLIGNEETFNFLSKTTNSQQVYYVGELVKGDAAKAAESLGSIKDWVSGNLSVEFTVNQPDFLGAQYIVTHQFILNPFYILSYREFIDNGTIPDLLAGDSSIKYAAEVELRKTLTNTGSSKLSDFAGLNGFVGWYGENFNGLNRKYAVLSTTYEDAGTTDPLDGININASTKATIVIDNFDGAISDYSCSLYLIRLPDSEDDYIGTETNLIDNFLLKSEIVSNPDTTTPNVTTSIISGDLVIEYTINYTVAERLQLTTEDEYLLLVQIEDPNIGAGDSDRVMLIADLKNYVEIDFLAGFVNIGKYDILQHTQDLGDVGSPVQVLSNEDGILLDSLVGVDRTRNVIINGISVQLLARNTNTGNTFQLDSYILNIGDFVDSGGIQQINVETTRGYSLPIGDNFNLVKMQTSGQAGDFQQYVLQLGQKIKWQDWIFNPDVDSVFFDASQPNNNLNEKTSNYSGKQDYEIYLAIVVNVTGEDDLGRLISGDSLNFNLILDTKDYDESDNGVTGTIQTFDLETGNSLEGNILYNGKDTLFRAVFQNAGTMQYGIHRIEPSQNRGDGILELSSVKPSIPNNILKPVTGETLLKFDLVGSDLTTECIIDGSLIQEGVQYKLSARVGQEPLILENPFTFTVNTSEAGVSGATEFQLPLIASGAYDIVVDKGNGDPFLFINTWNDPATLLDYSSTGAGNYTINIYGILRGWQFEDGGDAQKMVDIANWGTFQPTNEGVFFGCSNMDISATDIIDLSQTTTLSRFFRDCTILEFNTSIGFWDVSAIDTYSEMFREARAFNRSLNNWIINTSVPIVMNSMFNNARAYDQPMDNWDVSQVTNFGGMFQAAIVFDQDITGWVMSSAISVGSMFNNADAFNQPIGNWERVGSTLANVTNFGSMFQNNGIFNQPIDNWNTSGAINMALMFNAASSFNQPVNSWDVSGVTNMLGMFRDSDFNRPLNLWDVSLVTDMRDMFRDARDFDQDISGWITTALQRTDNMFRGADSFNRNLGGWDIGNLISASTMFIGAITLSTANLDALLNGWAAQVPSINNNVVFGAENTARSAASDAAVTTLTNAPYNWTINTL